VRYLKGVEEESLGTGCMDFLKFLNIYQAKRSFFQYSYLYFSYTFTIIKFHGFCMLCILSLFAKHRE